MHIEVTEFRQACDILVRFAQQHLGLRNEERQLVVNVVQSLEYSLAPPSALEQAENILDNLPLKD